MDTIKNTTPEEHKEMMDYMDQNLSEQERPKVGIFCYSPALCDVFGVVSVDAELQAQKGQISTIVDYEGDYQDVYRGRVFYLPNENKYIIAIGSWIDDFPEAIEIVKIEFGLEKQNVEIKRDIH